MAAGWRQHRFVHHDLALAWQDHGPADAFPLLALHGWRDNAASFHRFAALWPQRRILAPDFPGHGFSDWRHPQGSYSIWSYLEEVDALAAQYCPDSFDLLGHSMGGAVATLYAALYPARVRRLVLLDAIGPLATEAQDAPAQLLQARAQRQARQSGSRRLYPDFESAVSARANRGVDPDAARELAARGVRQDADGWYWHQDPRLAMRNPVAFTEAHSEAFLRRIECPVLLVAATRFWEGRMQWFERRTGYFRHLELHMLDGSHHQHMERQAPEVVRLVQEFLQR